MSFCVFVISCLCNCVCHQVSVTVLSCIFRIRVSKGVCIQNIIVSFLKLSIDMVNILNFLSKNNCLLFLVISLLKLECLSMAIILNMLSLTIEKPENLKYIIIYLKVSLLDSRYYKNYYISK